MRDLVSTSECLVIFSLLVTDQLYFSSLSIIFPKRETAILYSRDKGGALVGEEDPETKGGRGDSY